MLGGETEGYRESLVFPKEMDIIDKLVTVPQGRTPPEQTCQDHRVTSMPGCTEPLLSISTPLLLRIIFN